MSQFLKTRLQQKISRSCRIHFRWDFSSIWNGWNAEIVSFFWSLNTDFPPYWWAITHFYFYESLLQCVPIQRQLLRHQFLPHGSPPPCTCSSNSFQTSLLGAMIAHQIPPEVVRPAEREHPSVGEPKDQKGNWCLPTAEHLPTLVRWSKSDPGSPGPARQGGMPWRKRPGCCGIKKKKGTASET